MLHPFYSPRRIASRSGFDFIRNDIDAVMNALLSAGSGRAASPTTTRASAYPPLNIAEHEDVFVLEAELPGVKTEDLEVTVLGKELSIRGKRAQQKAEQSVRVHRAERPTGTFERSLTFACLLDPDKIEAELKNGILTIRAYKSSAARPRKIQISSNTGKEA